MSKTRTWFAATIAIFALGLAGIGTPSAQEAVPPSADDRNPQLAPEDENKEASITRTNCYTNVQDCAGYSTVGGFSYDVGCSIWWNNGANGRTNLTLRAGQTHEYYVRYNDVGACIELRYAPPRESPRFYMYVHN
jgi:hypothetical protein